MPLACFTEFQKMVVQLLVSTGIKLDNLTKRVQVLERVEFSIEQCNPQEDMINLEELMS